MELKFILEALLFSAQKPLSPAEIRDVFAKAGDEPEADATSPPRSKNSSKTTKPPPAAIGSCAWPGRGNS